MDDGWNHDGCGAQTGFSSIAAAAVPRFGGRPDSLDETQTKAPNHGGYHLFTLLLD